jgi:antitoxin (DNA-binding transcriptional repressor) of toxin-antitoxin stability system
MKAVGIRELKNRLSEYVRDVRQGEEIQVTHRGEVVAEMRPPYRTREEGSLHPGLRELLRRGTARRVVANDPSLYPRFERALSHTTAQELLDLERSDR